MAAGDLSEDQARFVAGLSERTGLDHTVVVAWVGTESGWSKTKAGHNYLNVGPGETYGSTDQAVARAAALIGGSPRYAGIRAAIPGGPVAQVKAIGASPWGTSASLLQRVYDDVRGRKLTGPERNALMDYWTTEREKAGLPPFSPNAPSIVPNPLDAAKGLGKVLGLDDLWRQALIVGLGLVFSLAAFGLIALGLSRLTDVSPREALGKAQAVTGVAGMARSVIR